MSAVPDVAAPGGEDAMSRNGGSGGGQGADGATFDPRALDDVVQRVVAVAQPERVVRSDAAGLVHPGC